MYSVLGVRISVIPPGSEVPAVLIDRTSTSASSEGRNCSVNDASSEVPPLLVVPFLTLARRLSVPVKELAPFEVCAASLTASSGVVDAVDDPPEPDDEPQAVRAAARIAVSPAAYSGVRAARACTKNLHCCLPVGRTSLMGGSRPPCTLAPYPRKQAL